jgi:hypothetical protein
MRGRVAGSAARRRPLLRRLRGLVPGLLRRRVLDRRVGYEGVE